MPSFSFKGIQHKKIRRRISGKSKSDKGKDRELTDENRDVGKVLINKKYEIVHT